jgi:enoyl-[acyl-carrier protein] reductase III
MTQTVAGAVTLGLEGKVALVTGATRGIGLAIARKLCACGCDVYLNYAASVQDAERAVETLTGLKGSATPLRGDVRRPGALADLVRTVTDRHPHLDILVHNAASWTAMPVLAADVEAFWADLQLGVNPLLTASATLASAMTAGGRVVAVSSSGARSVIPRYVSLGTTKAALESLVRYLAVELAPYQITVNAVSTSKVDKGLPGDRPVVEALASRTPAGRLTRPEDVADAVALLCTAEAAWLQGQVLTVDGGFGLGLGIGAAGPPRGPVPHGR